MGGGVRSGTRQLQKDGGRAGVPALAPPFCAGIPPGVPEKETSTRLHSLLLLTFFCPLIKLSGPIDRTVDNNHTKVGFGLVYNGVPSA